MSTESREGTPYLSRPEQYAVRAAIIGGRDGVAIYVSEYDVDCQHHLEQLAYYRERGPVKECVVLDEVDAEPAGHTPR